MVQGRSDGSHGIAPPGYRLPATMQVGRVRLQVADLARSLAFYEQVLGLRPLQRSLQRIGSGATLGAQGDETPLVELVERREARPMPRRGQLGLYHFALLLPNRAALGRFVARLAASGSSAGSSDHFVSEAMYLQDPDNLGVEVYADRPRSSWEYRGRELHMTVAPLDVPDLVQAAAGEPWAGMPAGTKMGHIHLHVGDLDEAARFYHNGLGFDKVVWSYPGALFLSAGGYHHHLGTNTWAAGASPAGEDDARLLEWELLLPDRHEAEAAAQSIEAAGYAATPADRDWLTTDPWGTALRLTTAEAVHPA